MPRVHRSAAATPCIRAHEAHPRRATLRGVSALQTTWSHTAISGVRTCGLQVSPTDEPLAGASNLRTRAQGKLTDGQDAEKGGARYEQSGSREQAAKNMSAAVHERTCVVARREAGGPIINQGNIACQLFQERDSDVCLFWAKSQHPSIQLLTFCQKNG